MPIARFVPTAALVPALIPALAAALAAPATLAPPALAQEAARFIPDSVAIALTVRQPDRQIEAFRELLDRHRFAESPLFETIEGNPGLMQAKIGLFGIAAAAGTDAWSAVGAILGKEITIALRPVEGAQPELIIVAVARDPARMDRLVQTVRTVSGAERNGEPDPSRSQLVGPVRVYQIGEGFECRVDDALIVTNSRALMRAALDARAGKTGRLADAPAFQATLADVPADAIAWAHVDGDTLRALTAKNDSQLIGNPLGGVLFGGWRHAFGGAESVSAWVSAMDDGLALDVEFSLAENLPATLRGFIPAGLNAPAWSGASIEGYLGEIAVARDWGELFSERESFLTLPAASQFVNFTSTLTTLMGRIDFVDDVLARTSGPVRLIMARQRFDDRAYEPSPKLPAFALIAPLHLDAPERFARQLHSAGLSALSVISLDAAQKGNPSLLIDTHEYAGIRVVSGEYAEPEMDDDGMMLAPGGAAAAIQYNFEPAVALIGSEFVVTTSVELMHRLIDIASAADDAVGGFALEDSAFIDVQRLARILRDNRDELITDRMLKKDQSKSAAAGDIDALLAAIGYAEHVRLTSAAGPRRFQARVEFSLRTPK